MVIFGLLLLFGTALAVVHLLNLHRLLLVRATLIEETCKVAIFWIGISLVRLLWAIVVVIGTSRLVACPREIVVLLTIVIVRLLRLLLAPTLLHGLLTLHRAHPFALIATLRHLLHLVVLLRVAHRLVLLASMRYEALVGVALHCGQDAGISSLLGHVLLLFVLLLLSVWHRLITTILVGKGGT